MDIHAILKQLPHRYPFLLVDKVVELERNTRILAVKNVTYNEPFFMGHFPGRPVMPGVLMLEALAQAAGLLAFDAMGQVPDENNIYYFVGIDSARFKRPVNELVELRTAKVGNLVKLNKRSIEFLNGIDHLAHSTPCLHKDRRSGNPQPELSKRIL